MYQPDGAWQVTLQELAFCSKSTEDAICGKLGMAHGGEYRVRELIKRVLIQVDGNLQIQMNDLEYPKLLPN